jgi:hypothetical protein
MPVPDQVRDDGFGIQKALELLDSGFRRNDKIRQLLTFYDFIFSCARKKSNGIESLSYAATKPFVAIPSSWSAIGPLFISGSSPAS